MLTVKNTSYVGPKSPTIGLEANINGEVIVDAEY